MHFMSRFGEFFSERIMKGLKQNKSKKMHFMCRFCEFSSDKIMKAIKPG